MQMGDGCDEAETQPVARSATASFQSIEALEHMLMFLDRDSRPIVGDGKRWALVTTLDLQDDLTPLATMLDSVVDKIGERIEQKVMITSHEHALDRKSTRLNPSTGYI